MTFHGLDTLGSAGFYGGDDVRITCHRYPDRAPILSLDGPRFHLLISTRDRGAGHSGLAFARELHTHVQTFLAECVRLAHDADEPDSTAG